MISDVVHFSSQHALDFVMAIIILTIGFAFAYYLKRYLVRLLEKNSHNQTASVFIISLAFSFVLFIVVIMALNKAGVPTTSLLTVLGASGLGIALALKGSLSNIASGIIIVFSKPFKVGDNVEVSGITGKIHELSLYNIVIKTPANELVYIPNTKGVSDKIVNKSIYETKKQTIVICLDLNTSIKQAKDEIKNILYNNDKVLLIPEPSISVSSLENSGITLNISAWVNNKDSALLKQEILEEIHHIFLLKNICLSRCLKYV